MSLFTNFAATTVAGRLPPVADVFAQAASRYGLSVEMLQALAAHESTMDPTAVGATNENGTTDYGLMQVNSVNYDGDPTDLLDPATNVELGAKVMSDAIAKAGGDVLWALSAYNRGFRTTYNGAPVVNGRLADGTFPNQSYVDDVVRWFQHFRQLAGKSTELSAANVQAAGLGGGALGLVIGLGLLGGLVWRWLK